MSLALSLCQYVLRSRRGLAQASPGLAQASPSLKAPRLQAFEARDLLQDQDKKVQEASFWVRFLHLKLIWILETERGPPLFEALIANSMLACLMLMCDFVTLAVAHSQGECPEVSCKACLSPCARGVVQQPELIQSSTRNINTRTKSEVNGPQESQVQRLKSCHSSQTKNTHQSSWSTERWIKRPMQISPLVKRVQCSRHNQ